MLVTIGKEFMMNPLVSGVIEDAMVERRNVRKTIAGEIERAENLITDRNNKLAEIDKQLAILQAALDAGTKSPATD